MKKLGAVLVVAVVCFVVGRLSNQAPVSAEGGAKNIDAAGAYEGTLTISDSDVPIEIELSRAHGSRVSGTVITEAAGQGLKPLPITSGSVEGKKVVFTASEKGKARLPGVQVVFRGQLEGERLAGDFQIAWSTKCSLKRLTKEERANRHPNANIRFGRTTQVACSGRLKALYTAALDYSLTSNYFPTASGKNPRAHESFNLLLQSFAGEELKPETFVCPAGEAVPAKVDEDGRFVLNAKNVGYAWLAKRTKKTGRTVPLACCKYYHGYEDKEGKHTGHVGRIVVVYTDGVVKTLDVKRDRAQLTDDYLPPGLTR